MNEQKIAPVLSDDEINQLCGYQASNTTMRACNDRDLARETEQAVLARVGAVREQALARLMPEVLASLKYHGQDVSLVADIESALKGTPAAAPELISVQEAWEAAGGNPGIKATKAELLHTLNVLDQVCDEADGKTPAAAVADAQPLGWVNVRPDGRPGSWLHHSAESAKSHDDTAIAGRPAGSKQVAVYPAPQSSGNPGPLAAELVLAAVDSGEWSIRRFMPDNALTDAANVEHAWAVQRERAPYCDSTGKRMWFGGTAIAALEAGRAAIAASKEGAAS